MSLLLGKKYFLLTKNKSIPGKRVQLVGSVTYDEALKLPYSIGVLAINERVIADTSSTSMESYFKDKIFFWAKSIDSGDNNQYVVWDDVVDFSNTTMLNAEFDYKMSLVVGLDVDFTTNSVIEYIKTAIANQYGTKVQLSIDTVGYDPSVMSEKEIFEDQLKKYQALMESLKSLQPLISVLSKLTTFDISGVYESIKAQMDDINGNIGAIAANLR